MAYWLEAVIGSIDLLSDTFRAHTAAVVVPLGQGLALTPVTDALLATWSRDASAAALGFRVLPAALVDLLATSSMAGRIAYVEAEYFAGSGQQRAAVWADGLLAFGPVAEDTDDDDQLPSGSSPISLALAYLGVIRGNHDDEFATIGLARQRKTSDWKP